MTIGTASLSIILPVLILLLSPSTTPLPPSHILSISQILALAASNSTNFKEATAGLDDEQKKILETSVRASVGGSRKAEEVREAPKISLKLFG